MTRLPYFPVIPAPGAFGHQHFWPWVERRWTDSGRDDGQGTCFSIVDHGIEELHFLMSGLHVIPAHE